jgi:aminoglycoside 6'-N-acetyltransferase
MAFPLLTKRLLIEPLETKDLSQFVSYRQNPDVAQFQSWDSSYSLDDAMALLDSQAGVRLPTAGQWLQLAIRNRASGELIGDLALHQLEEQPGDFEIGFTIATVHQRKGFAKEAAARLIQFLFDEIGSDRVQATCDSRNVASKNLLSYLGFVEKPERAWSEEFKGETVRVNYFELISPRGDQR